MKFKEMLKENTKQINEGMAQTVAKKFLNDVFKNKPIEFSWVGKNRKTGDNTDGTVKFTAVEALQKLAGATKGLENAEVFLIMLGDKKTINWWKDWLLNEAFRYTFDDSSLGTNRVVDMIYQQDKKFDWETQITSVSYGKDLFYTRKEK